MSSSVPPDFLPRARQIILPLVDTEDAREALLTDAFYLLPDSRLYYQIKREGNPLGFTTLCFKTLMDYGCVADNTHALGRLLNVAGLSYGVDKQAEIAALVQITNALCAETKPPLSGAPPTPFAAPAPTQTIATPLDERRPTVFISYSHVDDGFAGRLITDLTAASHACWIDTSKIRGGTDWQRAICDGINLSYALVVVCTRKALESEYVWDEIQWARTRRKLIIPVLLEDVTGDDRFFGLHRFQGIRFDRLEYADAFAELLSALGDPPTIDTSGPPRVPSRRAYELAYLDRLRFDDFRLEKFEVAEYASLGGVAQTRREVQDSWETLAMQQEFAVILHRKGDPAGIDSEPEEFTDAVSKITELRRVVVLGEPGAGKTHTLRAIGKPLYIAALENYAAPIPLLVKLGNWDTPEQPFEVFLREIMGELGAYLDDLFATNRVVLLLDGLNEFPADQRAHKYPQVEAFIKAHPDVMAVVTCREADYPISLGLHKVLIRPLDPLRIRDFARRALRVKDEAEGDRFFWKLAGGETVKAVWEKWERAGANFSLFWNANNIPRENPNVYGSTTGADDAVWHEQVRSSSAIIRLASNPYMLRMLLDVYIQFKGVLPGNRGQLFDQFVNVLLEREKLAKIDPETQAVTLTNEGWKLLDSLQRVAYEMQVQRAAGQGEDETSAGTSLPLEATRRILNDRLLYLGVSTSILNSGDVIRFSHQLLQEYFAAVYLRERIFKRATISSSQKGGGTRNLQAGDIWKKDQWWARTNWEEATILLAGLYSDDCTPILDWLADANPEVTALCIVRSGATTPEETRLRLRETWLPRLTDLAHDPDPRARAAIGRALGMFKVGDQIADNRPGVGLRSDGLPNIDWVVIPEGEFIYQEDQKLTLSAFEISRYPVTYVQFQAFIDDPTGFHDARWWMGLSIPDGHNTMPGDQAFKYGNHPRERVSWYDAIAFCRWLSWRLEALTPGLSPRGRGEYDSMNPATWLVRLPTEFEWEKAARGTDGREYPYEGDFDPVKGNTHQTGIGQSTAVGIFPTGASPYGVQDMSGNVWEWCLTNPTPDADRENIRSDNSRVLRGGSWYYRAQVLARAVYRYDNRPGDRDDFIGFRVCRPPSL